MKRIKGLLYTSLLMGILLASAPLEATIHAVIAADIEDKHIGRSTSVDLERVTHWIEQAAIELDEDLHLSVLAYHQFRSTDLFAEIQSLNVKAEDVVIIYYAGHGFHSSYQESEDPLPVLAFVDEPVALVRVLHEIKGQGPRLGLVVTDACNVHLKGPPLALLPLMEALKAPVGDWLGGPFSQLQGLLQESHGLYVLNSSQPGEASYSNDSQGGFFTYALIQTLLKADEQEEEMTWEEIFKHAAYRTTAETALLQLQIQGAGESPDLQHPQFFYFDLQPTQETELP